MMHKSFSQNDSERKIYAGFMILTESNLKTFSMKMFALLKTIQSCALILTVIFLGAPRS